MNEYYLEPQGIYYRTNKIDSKRQTIVFVHGLSGSSSAWVSYEKELGRDFNILSYDLRGHGKSKKYQLFEEYKIEYFADDLFALTEHLHLENFVLVGHSFGCSVILSYLKGYQQKVSKVIFLSPNAFIGGGMKPMITSPIVQLGVNILQFLPFLGGTGRHIDYSQTIGTKDWDISRIIADIRNTTLHVYLYTIKHSYAFSTEDCLSDIRLPSLIIHGKRDTIFPVGCGIKVAQKIKDAELVILEDSNHFPIFNNKKEVLEEIENFVI